MGANTQVNQVSQKASEQANAFVRLMKSSYKVTMEAGEEMSLRALDIPADILEQMGVAGDRAKSFKRFNRKMVGGIYRGLDNLAETVSGGIAAPVDGVSKLLGKLGRKGSREAAKLTETAKKATKDVKKATKDVKKATKDVKKAATPAKAEKVVVKAKPKARKTTATARKARAGAAKKTEAAGKKVTSKLAA